MQTPKGRNSSLEVPQKISPRAVSSEVPQKKISPRAVRQLKTNALESESSSSSNQASRTPKDRSPKVSERKSPRSPVSEKRPSKIAQLESEISQLQTDLKKVKDLLCSSESLKKQAQQEAEDSKKQLSALVSKLEESQKQLFERFASEDSNLVELRNISKERDQAWESELEAIQTQHSVESATLTSALNEINQLKVQLEMVAASEATQTRQAESAHAELHRLKENLAKNLLVLEDMKNQLTNCKESEAEAQALVRETLLELDTAKRSLETLSSDGNMEDYNAIASELDQSKARANLLEGLVKKLKDDICYAASKNISNPTDDRKLECETTENEMTGKLIEAEVSSMKSEVERLISALEAAEIRCHEEQTRSTVQIRSAYELVEQMKSTSSLREAELEAELKKLKIDVEELKANLMDKETELQGICEENEGLNMRLENARSAHRELDLEKDMKKSKENIENLKANLMDKETELQNILEENEVLKLETKKKETNRGKVNDEVVAELEAARTAEREALMKLGYMMEEADKSNRKAARVVEQLEAVQAENSEMEAELRRLKVQSDQWRKAAEAAAAMISTGNNGKFMGRTGSLDSNCSPMAGNIGSPYSEDMEDDLLKKKNGNMLKRIGVLWKKPHK